MEIIDQTAKVVMLKGEGGDTIKSIDKTTTQGLVDIYTITLESGNKTTFNVTNGNGIKTIEKTSTSGLIDTYTITFDNGETTTFNVTNGEKGEKGDKGDTGPQGPQGPKGEKGDPGDGGGIANVDAELSATSTNPVQNKAIAEGINSIQTQIVPTASIERGETASKAYSKGDFLVKDGALYKVTNAIVKDDVLTDGTNIVITTVGGELSEIKSNSSDRVQLSLDAVAVGKDEDGNTVYEKTFKGSTISSGTVIDSNLTMSKLKWIRLVGGCINNSGGSLSVLPYDVYSDTRYNFVVFSNSKGLVVEYHSITVKMYHFTVQYVLK